MRAPSENDFFVDVDGIGTFRFARRTFGDRIAIRREYIRLTGNVDDVQLASLAVAAASLSILMVDGPDGWRDIQEVDFSVDQDLAEDRIYEIYDKMRATEDSFRKSSDKKSQKNGEGAGGDNSVLVPEEIQHATQRPEVSGALAGGS